MLQAFMSLDDDQIIKVLDAVRLWCAERNALTAQTDIAR